MEILRREGVHFESIEAAVDDAATPPQGDPREVARALAVAKAQAVAAAARDRGSFDGADKAGGGGGECAPCPRGKGVGNRAPQPLSRTPLAPLGYAGGRRNAR